MNLKNRKILYSLGVAGIVGYYAVSGMTASAFAEEDTKKCKDLDGWYVLTNQVGGENSKHIEVNPNNTYKIGFLLKSNKQKNGKDGEDDKGEKGTSPQASAPKIKKDDPSKCSVYTSLTLRIKTDPWDMKSNKSIDSGGLKTMTIPVFQNKDAVKNSGAPIIFNNREVELIEKAQKAAEDLYNARKIKSYTETLKLYDNGHYFLVTKAGQSNQNNGGNGGGNNGNGGEKPKHPTPPASSCNITVNCGNGSVIPNEGNNNSSVRYPGGGYGNVGSGTGKSLRVMKTGAIDQKKALMLSSSAVVGGIGLLAASRFFNKRRNR